MTECSAKRVGLSRSIIHRWKRNQAGKKTLIYGILFSEQTCSKWVWCYPCSHVVSSKRFSMLYIGHWIHQGWLGNNMGMATSITHSCYTAWSGPCGGPHTSWSCRSCSKWSAFFRAEATNLLRFCRKFFSSIHRSNSKRTSKFLDLKQSTGLNRKRMILQLMSGPMLASCKLCY